MTITSNITNIFVEMITFERPQSFKNSNRSNIPLNFIYPVYQPFLDKINVNRTISIELGNSYFVWLFHLDILVVTCPLSKYFFAVNLITFLYYCVHNLFVFDSAFKMSFRRSFQTRGRLSKRDISRNRLENFKREVVTDAHSIPLGNSTTTNFFKLNSSPGSGI